MSVVSGKIVALSLLEAGFNTDDAAASAGASRLAS